MITPKTLKAYGLDTIEDFVDMLIGMVIEGKDINRQVSKMSPQQKLDAMYYLGGSEAEECIVLKNIIRNQK